jgi:hypothetical protein
MGPLCVVVCDPRRDLRARTTDLDKQTFVQQFVAHAEAGAFASLSCAKWRLQRAIGRRDRDGGRVPVARHRPMRFFLLNPSSR